MTTANDHNGTARELASDLVDQVVAATPDAILVLDAQGVIRFANQAAEEIFGRDRDQLVGHDFGRPLTINGRGRIQLPGPDRDITVDMRASKLPNADEDLTVVTLRDLTDPIAQEVSRLHLHVQGMSRRLAELEHRLSELEGRQASHERDH